MDEDYRWAVLRKVIPMWLFHVTNLTFIGKLFPITRTLGTDPDLPAAIQNVILLLLGFPTHAAATAPNHAGPLTTADYALTGLALLTLLLEFTSDNQQHAYQSFKHALKNSHSVQSVVEQTNRAAWPGARIAWTTEDAERGFITRGLWAWSRHPNFLCEQTFWVRL